MEYNKGDRVKHPKLEAWGLGEVLADSNGESVKVFLSEWVKRTCR